MTTTRSAGDVIKFWFEELEPKDWWAKSTTLDKKISERFAATHRAARCGDLWTWRDTPSGRLAEIIVLDQFSRNMFRDTPDMFTADIQALVLAQEAVRLGVDAKLQLAQVKFLYMPYMHSESLSIHEQALTLFAAPGLEDNLKFEHRHRDIILRFGRYPHRNAILGRDSSADELDFLNGPGSSF